MKEMSECWFRFILQEIELKMCGANLKFVSGYQAALLVYYCGHKDYRLMKVVILVLNPAEGWAKCI